MPALCEKKTTAILRLSRWSAAIVLLTGSLLSAVVMISFRHTISIPLLDNGSANTGSPDYKIETGTLGQALAGSSQSANYRNSGGFADPARTAPGAAAGNLAEAYVYPNPFKPNSPGSFQANKLTFKRLPPEVTIKIFALTGRQVAELHKRGTSDDHYEWDATNADGKKLASGVYIYFITAPGGGKAKGKFAVIR